MPESYLAFHLDRIRQHGVDRSHLTSGIRGNGRSGENESLRHAGMLLAVLIAGNQDPPYEARLEEHGDYADAEVLLHPDELAFLPTANQFVALFANGISGRSYTDR